MMLVLALVSVLAASVAPVSVSGAVISAIYPRSGSLLGGQQLTLSGSGFMRAEEEGATTVYIGNNKCTQIEYYSTDTQFVCVTPPAFGGLEGTYTVQMVLEGVSANSYAACLLSACQFAYRDQYTSTVSFFPVAAGGGAILPFQGSFVDASLFAHLSVRFGQYWCDMDYVMQSEWIQHYGNNSAVQAKGYLSNYLEEPVNTNDLRCWVLDQPAGRSNLTVAVNPPSDPSAQVWVDQHGGGYAELPHTQYRVSLDGADEVYTFTTFPVVTTLSSVAGGEQGGSILTIRGSGFDPECRATEVKLAGQPCKILSCSADQLTCVPSAVDTIPQPNQPGAFSGSRGLHTEVWKSAGGWNTLPIMFNQAAATGPAPITTAQAASLRGPYMPANQFYAAQSQGVFTAPFTATYNFLVAGGDKAELSLGSNSDASTLARIASCDGDCSAFFTGASQVSADVQLQAGENYAIKLRSIKNGGSIDTAVTLRMDPATVDNSTGPALPEGYPSSNVLSYNSLPTIMRVAVATDVRREIQSIAFSGISGGEFKLQYGTKVSDSLYLQNTTTTLIRNALASTLSDAGVCSSLTVTLQRFAAETRSVINVTFNCPGATARNLLNVQNVALKADNSAGLAFNMRVTRVQTPSIPASGYFQLAWNNVPGDVLNTPEVNLDREYSPRINFDASATAMEQALLQIAGVRKVQASISGDTRDGRTWTLTIYTPHGRIEPLQSLFNNTLLGENARVEITTLREGDSSKHYWLELPGDFLSQAAPVSRVEVSVAGVKAVCGAGAAATSSYAVQGTNSSIDCVYAYTPSLTPTITNLSPADTIAAGTVLTVTGTNFDVSGMDGTNVIAFARDTAALAADFAALPSCFATVVSSTELTCEVPELSAGNYVVQVNVRNKGINAPHALPTLAFALRVDGVSPARGSQAGGTLLKLAGSGFQTVLSGAGADVITVNGLPCALEDVTTTAVLCRTPALPADDATPTDPKDVLVNAVSAGTFTYDAALTPSISTVTPSVVSSAVTNLITITGTGFVADENSAPERPSDSDKRTLFDLFSVNFGDRECAVVSSEATQIVCRLARAAPPNLHSTSNARAPTVYVAGQGYAANPSDLTVDIALRVHSLSASHGSLAGGLVLTIAGQGFKPQRKLVTDHSVSIDPEYISVKLTVNVSRPDPATGIERPTLVTFPCAVSSYEMAWVECRITNTNISAASLGAGGAIVAQVNVSINNVNSVCGGATDEGCQFEFRADDTPSIASILPMAALAGEEITITGEGLDRPDARVYIGHADCPITDQNDTAITCTVPVSAAATLPVYVHFNATGFAEAPQGLLRFTTKQQMESLDVNAGSVAGGSIVVITGSGFSPVPAQNNVTFNGAKAYVLAASEGSLQVLTPAVTPSSVSTAGGALSVDVRVVTKSYLYLADFFAADIVLANVNEFYTLRASPSSMLTGAFSYQTALTPVLTSVTPLTGSAGTAITIAGSAFGASQPADSNVVVGGAMCVITSWTDTAVVCTVGNTPAGQHAVLLTVGGKGFAGTTSGALIRFTAALTITGVAPLQGGYGGGTVLTVSGTGFSGVAAETVVNVCNAPCLVQSSSYNQLTCVTTPLVTLDRLRHFGGTLVFQAQGTASGTNAQSASGPNGYAAAFDGNVETGFIGNSGGVSTLRLDTGALTNVALTRIRFYSAYQKAQLLLGGEFAVSDDGTAWTTVATITTAQEGWNTIDLIDTNTPNPEVTRSYRYFRFSAGNGARVMEVEFQGYRVAAGFNTLSDPPMDTASCPVSAQVTSIPASNPAGADLASPLTTASTSLNFAYSLVATPTVISIAPEFASALGGETVTITGTGFVASNAAAHEVRLNDYPCAVQSVNAEGTQLTCVTGERIEARMSPTGREISVQVNPASGVPLTTPSGFALLVPNPDLNVSPLANQAVTASFRYLDRWSALTTWRFQEPPVEGDFVQIPQGQAVLLDVDTPVLSFLLIQGLLVFEAKDLHLQSEYIYVQGGQLQVGTETRPFLNKATITLHGDRWKSVELPHYGSKVLVNGPINWSMKDGVGAVKTTPGLKSGVIPSTLQNFYTDPLDGRGRLDLHGIPRLRTWTKVETTALAGTSTLTTSEDVDFAPGEEVVITSHRIWSQTERRIVASLGADKRTVTFTEPLSYDHVSERHTYPGHSEVDMRYEIGLLTRNIVVQGDSNSHKQQFGGHVMSLANAIMRVENIEMRFMGQSNNLGRYNIHWHLAGQVPDSYVKSNSIHDSFQRACTVHGSHYARVQNNVAAFIKGHTYFVEDGNEKFNVLEGNLGVHTTRLTSMLRSDTKPATFWTSSPENFWRHNVAAGCINDGYWLELPGSPGGPSYSSTICPVHGHLGEFFNNTAHANGVHGLRVYPVYLPRLNPCDGNSGPAPQTFTNFTSFHNGDNGIFGKHNGDLHHRHAKLVENGNSEIAWVKLEEIDWESALIPHIQDSLFVATTDPDNRPFRATHKHAIWSPQREHFHIDGATFVNYADAGAIAGCFECGEDDTLSQGGYTIRTGNLNFINSAKRVKHTLPFKEIWFDKDGSLTGIVNGSVTYARDFNKWAECSVDTTGELDFGIKCDASVRIRRMQFDGVTPQEMDFLYIAATQANGPGQISAIPAGQVAGRSTVPFLVKEIYGWVLPMVTSHWYDLTWVTRMDWRTLRIRHSDPDLVRYLGVPGQAESEFMGFNLNYTDYRYNFAVVSSDNRMRPWKETPVTGSDDTGVGAMGNAVGGRNGTWSVVSSSRNSSLFDSAVEDPLVLNIRALQCPLSGCPLPPKPDIGNLTRWSDPLTWPSGRVPTTGEHVTITNTMNVLFDLSGDFVFERLDVEGALTFEDGHDINLAAEAIVVLGSLQAGTPELPYSSKLTFTLRGERSTPTVVVSNSLFLGNKVFVVLGNCTLYGTPRVATTATLFTTLLQGSTELTLTESPDWKIGDEIVVSPTSYASQQAEKFKIIAISGSSVILDHAAQYDHFALDVNTAAPTNPTGPASVHLAASVGLLTRSITITSDLSTEANYGGHVEVAEVPSEPAGSTSPLIGTFTASFVDFRNLGQGEMEAPALHFTYFPTQAGTAYAVDPKLKLNQVVGCAFTEGFNYAIKGEGSPNLLIERSVMYRTYRSSVFLDDQSPGVVLKGNLIMDTRRSLDYTGLWLQPFAGIYVDAPVAEMRDNVVSGSEDGGIVYHPEACGSSAAVVTGNRVHSSKIGVWLLSNGRWGCVRATGFTSWLASHLAFTTIDQTNVLEVSNLVTADSHIGVSLNFYGGLPNSKATISDSVILGSTPATATSCSVNSVCMAATGEDRAGVGCNSVYGAGVRRIGLMTTQYTNRGKTCFIDGMYGEGLPVCRPPTTPERECGLPWEKRYGLPNDGGFGELHVLRTTFAHFAVSDCSQRSAAFAWNPSSRDLVPPIFMRGIGWGPNVDEDAKFDLAYRPELPGSESDCATGCDGLNQINIADLDGTAMTRSIAAPTSSYTSRGHTLLSRNVLLANPGSACMEHPAWGAIECPDLTYRQLVVENMDFDRGMRKVGPLHSTHLLMSENRTDHSWGPIDDSCPMRFFFGQYYTQVQPGSAYHLEFAGSNPAITRITLHSSDPTDAVLVRFFYTQPLVLDVLIDGQVVDRNNLVTPTLDSAAGASQFSAQERHITLLLRGNADLRKQVYSIVQKPIVQVTLTLAVDISTFYGPTLVSNLALLLSIDPSRIKIVSVQPGSTVVQMQIADANPSPANTTENNAQVGRLTELSSSITQLAADGYLNRDTIGYDLISLSMTLPSANGTVPTPEGVTLGPSRASSKSDGLSPLIIGVIVVVSVLLAGAFASVCYVMHRRRVQTAAARFLNNGGVHVHGVKKTASDFLTSQDDEAPSHAPTNKIEVAPRSPSGVAPSAPPAEIEMAGPGALSSTETHENDIPTVRLHPGGALAEGHRFGGPGALSSGSPLTVVPELDSQSRGESQSQWKSAAAGSGPSDAYRMTDLPEGHYVCSRSYAPKFADELSLTAGDVVIVLDGSSADWYIGYNTRTGKRGSFPKSVVSRSQRIAKPEGVAAAAEVDTGAKSANSASLSRSLSGNESNMRVASVHGRVASVDEILAAQELGRAASSSSHGAGAAGAAGAAGWSAFEPAVASYARGNRVVDSLVHVDAGVPGVPLPVGATVAGRAIQHKHSGMDRQQSRR